jgi:hypothetical protein
MTEMAAIRYEFRVDGGLSEAIQAAFPDMRIIEAPRETIIVGKVLDESHLHGIIAQLETLGITVVSVHPFPG